MRAKRSLIDIQIDKLTNSIEERTTGKSVQTLVLPFSTSDKGYRKNEWVFNWKKELKSGEFFVYKLVLTEQKEIIQGLISFKPKTDHLYVNLIESALINQGKRKKYLGVPGNLFAIACLESRKLGFKGVISFTA